MNSHSVNFEDSILAMLTKNGGKLYQMDIINELDLPFDLLSTGIKEMEKQGLIVRKSSFEDYIVSLVKK